MNASEFRQGQRVALSPACDLWMRGARYGIVARIGRIYVYVLVDHIERILPFRPELLTVVE